MSKDSTSRYYQKYKQKIQIKKKSCERHQHLSKEEKSNKWEYSRESYKNLSENEKPKLVEYSKNMKCEKIKICYKISWYFLVFKANLK